MSYKILVIDDDETILRLIKNILQLSGYEVTTRNGIEEVNICDFVDFDLILLDIMMPLDGIAICNEIREQIKAPILFITAKDMEEDLVNGLLAGADDYITKPFRRHFTKKVLVVGSASGGKTTLIKDLGRVFNAPISLEYARFYQEFYNVRDDELDTNDYIRLFANQNEQTSNVIDSGSHTGIVFVDTNATVTMAYVDYYLKDIISEEEYQALKLSYKVAISKEKWDLIILIPPKSAYVNDGFRDMSMASQDIRDDFTNHLIYLLERDGFKDQLLILDSDENTFFLDN